jgi:hypothetical protein
MAKGDVRVIANGGLQAPPAGKYRTEAAATAIYTGEPVKVGGTGTNYVIPSADAEPVTSAPTFVGIAASDSEHTASADGDIDIILATPLVMFEAKAKSAAAVDTQAEINALLNDLVAFDLTSSTYTVDTASAASTNGLIITGGNTVLGTVYFRVRSGATVFA